MKSKIVIPTIDGQTISEHFGRAPYFTIIELDDQANKISTQNIPNTSDHFGGSGKPKDLLLTLNPTALIVHSMGPGALQAFEQVGVPVFRAQSSNVDEALTEYMNGKLERLSQGCSHSSHREHHR